MFFTWRIWKLSNSFIMPFIITLVIIGQAAFAIKTGMIVRIPSHLSHIA